MAIFTIMLTLSASIIKLSPAAKILAVVPTPSYSHQITFWPIWKELSLRGHQVTLITTDPIQDSTLTNLTQIDISFLYEYNEEINYSSKLIEYQGDLFRYVDFMLESSKAITKRILSYGDVANLMRNPRGKFDLVMCEYINPVFFALPKKFNTPFIGLLSTDWNWMAHDCLGNPSHPVLYPEAMTPYATDLTFFQRLSSSLTTDIMRLTVRKSLGEMNTLVGDFFGGDYPPIGELACSVDMIFVNTNPVLNNVRPVVPAMVQIGRDLHSRIAKPIPEDLRNYLESGGPIVYFSLGTNVKSVSLGNELKKTLLESFANLPFRVVWKFEDDELPGRPENVRIFKWLPQQDLLKHPNVKVFVTHGGAQSFEEAFFSHVPMVCIPFIADQENNCVKIAQKGLGIILNPRNLDKNTFRAAVLDVAQNKRYYQNVKRLAELASDEPMSGLEKAVWWTEYVLRHKGAKHLNGPAVDVPLYQFLLLDVMAFCMVSLGILVYIFWKIMQSSFRFVLSLKQNERLTPITQKEPPLTFKKTQ